MKLILVAPPFGEKGSKGIVAPVAPPALEYLAGLTLRLRSDIEVLLFDANLQDFDAAEIEADLVGFTVHTVQAPWVYRTADLLRKRGIKVVMGGVHVTAHPEEAVLHADALVTGEAESVWESVLNDLEKGCLEKIYEGKQLPLINLPWPRTDLFSNRYMLSSFFTARGCPRGCKFCSVQKYFGRKVRFRPIDEVVAQISASSNKLFWNLDDNCWGTSVNRSIELYREMAQNLKRKTWVGMADLVSLDHPRADELLLWAQRSGLAYVRIGWESSNLTTLDHYNAKVKQGKSRVDAIKRIRAAGIDVMLFVIVGGRQDTLQDFEEIQKLSDSLDVAIRPVMMTPHPQTDLFAEYEPYLIPGLGWDYFDGYHAVFEHPTMSPQERESALIRLWQKSYDLSKIFRRLTKISLKGFPVTHITSFMIQYFESRPFYKYPRSFPTGKRIR